MTSLSPRRALAAVLLLLQAAPPVRAAKPAADVAQSMTFEFSSAEMEQTLADFLKFVQTKAPGLDGLRAQYLVADLLMQSGRYEKAAEILQKLAAVALDEDFFNVSVLQRLADCYLHQGLFQQAAQAYTTTSNSAVKAVVPEAVLGLAVTSLALGDREQAYLRLQELLAFYPAYKTQTRLMLPMGLIQWENEKYEEALEFLSRNPDDPACLYFAGLSQRSLEKPVEAMATFKTVVRKFPKSSWATRAKFELGETFYQKRDFPLAMENFRPLTQEGKFWETLALYRLACSDMRLRRHKEAEAKLWPLQKKERDHALHPSVTYLLTESLAEQGKIDQVVRLLKEDTKGKARTPDSSYRLIWSLTAIGDYDEAIRLSNEFLNSTYDAELTPKTLIVQGYAFEKLGREPEAAASYQLAADNFPDTAYAARALQLMSMAYFRSRQYSPVVTHVYHQWNTLPAEVRQKHPETLFWIGEAHLELKNGKEARRFYQDFLDRAPPEHALITQALLGQAVSHAVDKDFETAVLTLQRTYQGAQERKNTPLMAAVMLEIGNVFFNAKDYENAAASYRNFRQIDPKHAQAAFGLFQEGLSLHRAEYYSDATAAWARLVKEHPKDAKAPEALFRKAKTHFDLGQYPEAVKDYEQLVKSYSGSDYQKDARLQIGQCHYNAGNFAKAIANYTDWLARYPDDPQAPAVLQLLQTSYYQAKKTPEEIEKLTQDQPKSAILADIYWEEGAKHYNEKAYEKARGYFQKILSEFPSSSLAPQASFYRAESLYLEEKFVEAIPAYENFLQYYPDDAQRSLAMFHLSVALFNQKDYLKSADAFAAFAAEFPDDAMAKNANLNVAICYAKAQEIDKAVAAYEKYLAIYPGSEDAGAVHLQVGQLLEKAAREKEAARAYRRAPAGSPERAEALFSAGRASRTVNDAAGEQAAYEDLRAHAPANDPYRIAGLLQLAEIYLTQNQAAKAADVYRDVAQNGDEQSAAAAQERLKVLGQ
jgi:TolA-binding protein